MTTARSSACPEVTQLTAPRPPETLDALAGRRRGAAPRGSQRMAALCERLGDPQRGLDTIHVVGTDGKTSITRTIVALLVALGHRVGDTTSPHLEHVNERIRIDGEPIDDAAGEWAARRVAAALRVLDTELEHPVTFFEAVTGAAFDVFRRHAVEVAVVEAGIGGTGDATSVVEANTTVVTPIGLDHAELGADLAAVTREKAGVVATGGVLVSSSQPHPVTTVLRQIAEVRGARLVHAGDDFGVFTRRQLPEGQMVGLRGLDGSRVRGWLGLHGAHQAANAAVALAAVQAHLGTTDLDPARLRAGLAAVRSPGRVEIVRRIGKPMLLLDGAHDGMAARTLAGCVSELAGNRPVMVIIGVGGGRDATEIAAPLRDVAHRFVATEASSPGASPATAVGASLTGAGLAVHVVPHPAMALADVDDQLGGDGCVVVTGSLHLVGEVRAHIAAAARAATTVDAAGGRAVTVAPAGGPAPAVASDAGTGTTVSLAS